MYCEWCGCIHAPCYRFVYPTLMLPLSPLYIYHNLKMHIWFICWIHWMSVELRLFIPKTTNLYFTSIRCCCCCCCCYVCFFFDFWIGKLIFVKGNEKWKSWGRMSNLWKRNRHTQTDREIEKKCSFARRLEIENENSETPTRDSFSVHKSTFKLLHVANRELEHLWTFVFCRYTLSEIDFQWFLYVWT